MEDIPKAKECLNRSLEMQAASALQTYSSAGHYCSSLVHKQTGDFRTASQYAEKAVNLARKNKEKRFEGISLVQMGWTEWKNKSCDFITAEQNIMEGIRILKQLQARPDEARGYLTLGNLYNTGGQREKAFENLERAEKMLEKMGMEYSLTEARKLIANLS